MCTLKTAQMFISERFNTLHCSTGPERRKNVEKNNYPIKIK
jgi:hypothetical protein